MGADTHTIERTSPKGPGQKFVGRCIKCGATELTMGDAFKPCPNPSGVSKDDALVRSIEGGNDDR